MQRNMEFLTVCSWGPSPVILLAFHWSCPTFGCCFMLQPHHYVYPVPTRITLASGFSLTRHPLKFIPTLPSLPSHQTTTLTSLLHLKRRRRKKQLRPQKMRGRMEDIIDNYLDFSLLSEFVIFLIMLWKVHLWCFLFLLMPENHDQQGSRGCRCRS